MIRHRGDPQSSIAGICGINIDPVQASGGYIVGDDGITTGNERHNNWLSWDYLEGFVSAHWKVSVVYYLGIL